MMQLFLFDSFNQSHTCNTGLSILTWGSNHSNLSLDCRSLTFNEDDKQMGINSCQSLATLLVGKDITVASIYDYRRTEFQSESRSLSKRKRTVVWQPTLYTLYTTGTSSQQDEAVSCLSCLT